MNRTLTAAVFAVLMSGSALATALVGSLPDQAGMSAPSFDTTPLKGDFAAPLGRRYAAGAPLELYGSRPTEEELACMTWGVCKPDGRRA
jgi:hypothetical protein